MHILLFKFILLGACVCVLLRFFLSIISASTHSSFNRRQTFNKIKPEICLMSLVSLNYYFLILILIYSHNTYKAAPLCLNFTNLKLLFVIQINHKKKQNKFQNYSCTLTIFHLMLQHKLSTSSRVLHTNSGQVAEFTCVYTSSTFLSSKEKINILEIEISMKDSIQSIR